MRSSGPFGSLEIDDAIFVRDLVVSPTCQVETTQTSRRQGRPVKVEEEKPAEAAVPFARGCRGKRATPHRLRRRRREAAVAERSRSNAERAPIRRSGWGALKKKDKSRRSLRRCRRAPGPLTTRRVVDARSARPTVAARWV